MKRRNHKGIDEMILDKKILFFENGEVNVTNVKYISPAGKRGHGSFRCDDPNINLKIGMTLAIDFDTGEIREYDIYYSNCGEYYLRLV